MDEKKDALMEKTPDGGILSKEETERAAECSGRIISRNIRY